jgi:SAM-dependent methyltransferase
LTALIFIVPAGLCSVIVELYHFPADLEQWIGEVAGDEAASEQELGAAVRSLSDLFVGRSAWRNDYGRSPRLRRAYLRYYLPVNLPKVRVPLAAWLRSDPHRFAGRRLRCLDLGSGPGTALVGLCDFVRGLRPADQPQALELVALEQSYESLRDAGALIRRFTEDRAGPEVLFEPLRLDLVADRTELFPLAAAGGAFDLVLAANVLCEIVRGSPQGIGEAEALITAAAERLLAPGGAILIVEPGLKQTSRDLHHLRDRLLARGSLRVHAPCLHEAPCPALRTDRDWCIADLAWEPPGMVRRIEERTGLRKSSLKFSYLVLAPEPPPTPHPARWRVVSDVLDFKGERRVYLCAEGRWIVLGQLKRHGPAAGGALSGLRRGDSIEVHGMRPAGGLFRLPPTGTIRRIAEASDAAFTRILPE